MNIIFAIVTITLVAGDGSRFFATSHSMHPLSDELIEFINFKQKQWKAGRNFHKHTPLEYLKKLTGTIKVNLTLSDAGRPPRYKHTQLLLNFDGRDKWSEQCGSILNDIRDQGNCGCCWAVAAASAMTDRLCIQSHGHEKRYFSETDIMNCCMNHCGGVCTGGLLPKAWQFGVHDGVVSGGKFDSHEGCQPFPLEPCKHFNPFHYSSSVYPCVGRIPKMTCNNKCEPNYKKTYRKDKRRLDKYYLLTNMTEIMFELEQYGPVTTSFSVYGDFFNYRSGVYHRVKEAGQFVGNHSVKVIGWGEEDGIPYWLAANSWNTYWGNKGFFKILRGKNHLGIEDAMYAGIFRIKKYNKHWKKRRT